MMLRPYCLRRKRRQERPWGAALSTDQNNEQKRLLREALNALNRTRVAFEALEQFYGVIHQARGRYYAVVGISNQLTDIKTKLYDLSEAVTRTERPA